jgi:hypothetical protein
MTIHASTKTITSRRLTSRHQRRKKYNADNDIKTRHTRRRYKDPSSASSIGSIGNGSDDSRGNGANRNKSFEGNKHEELFTMNQGKTHQHQYINTNHGQEDQTGQNVKIMR